MKKSLFLLIVLSTLLTACEDEPVSQEISPDAQKKFETFVFPDSIRRDRIVVTYYDPHSPSHGVIYLTDSAGKNATAARYQANGSVTIDRLWKIHSTEFESISSKVVYSIKDKTVGHINPTLHADPSFDYIRTDVAQ